MYVSVCLSVPQQSHIAAAHPLLGALGAAAAAKAAAGLGAAAALSKASELTKDVPKYPTATDYSSGVCAGK